MKSDHKSSPCHKVIGELKKTCIISRLPPTHISSFTKYFQHFWVSLDPVNVFICHIFSLLITNATKVLNKGRKKDVHNLQTVIYPYDMFYKIFSVLLHFHCIPFLYKICHILRLFVAISTKVFNIERKEKHLHCL
jgi:hypothetical protein